MKTGRNGKMRIIIIGNWMLNFEKKKVKRRKMQTEKNRWQKKRKIK